MENPIVLYGGAGGGGKSYALRATAVYALLLLMANGFSSAPVMLASTDYPRLADRHFAKLQEEYAWLGAKLKTSAQYRLHIEFRAASGLGPLLLRNLANPDGFRGSEVPLVLIDEPSELPEKIKAQPVLGLLLYPLRSSVGWPFRALGMGSNGDGLGHFWLKGLFITGKDVKPGQEQRFRFIPAKKDDNQFLDEHWADNLEYLSEHVRRARLEGSWDSPEGVRWPTLRAETHRFNLRERFPQGIPKAWPRYMGVDYGYRAPYAAVTGAVDGRDVYVYRERYAAQKVALEQAFDIQQTTLEHEQIEALLYDPAMDNNMPKEARENLPAKAYIDDYKSVLGNDARFRRLVAADNHRHMGFAVLDRMIYHSAEHGRLFISDDCPNLWRELTEAMWFDSTGTKQWVEDIDPNCMDHGIDALRYMLMGIHLRTSRQARHKTKIERLYDNEQRRFRAEVMG